MHTLKRARWSHTVEFCPLSSGECLVRLDDREDSVRNKNADSRRAQRRRNKARTSSPSLVLTIFGRSGALVVIQRSRKGGVADGGVCPSSPACSSAASPGT